MDVGLRKDNNMESIKSESKINSEIENKNDSKNENQKLDRVVLDSTSINVLNNMMAQINSKLGDLVQVSQKDLVNFLIQNRSGELSSKEVEMIRIEKYDVVRILKLATSEAIRAKQSGKDINLDEVLKIIQTPSVNLERPPIKARGRKKKSESPSDINNQMELNISNRSAVKKPSKANSTITPTDSKSTEFTKFSSSEIS